VEQWNVKGGSMQFGEIFLTARVIAVASTSTTNGSSAAQAPRAWRWFDYLTA
jgi:hypothetical protein